MTALDLQADVSEGVGARVGEVLPVRPASQALAPLLSATAGRTLARCAGTCTCGGSCRTDSELDEEWRHRSLLARSAPAAVLALQRAAGNRAVAAKLSPGERRLQRAAKGLGEPGRRPDLWLGDTGAAVRAVQSLLDVPVTGVFDEATRLAVVKFRKATFGETDPAGGVGPGTWQKLDELPKAQGSPGKRPDLWLGDKGPAVILLQSRLNITQTGVFDERTRLEVVHYRKAAFKESDPAGGVGPATWASIDAMGAKQDKSGLCGGWHPCTAPGECDVPDGTGGTSDAWEISLAIDLEVASADDVTARGAEVGHVYVQFKGGDGKLWSYGFYNDPADPQGTPDPIQHPKAMGCLVHPDRIHDPCIDHRQNYTVTAEGYQKALALAQAFCKTPEKYELMDFNCTTFAARIVETAGGTVPAYRGKVGGTAGVTADNPYTLMQSLNAAVPTKDLTDAGAIHDWLQKHSYDDIAKLPEAEKKRLIRVVLDKTWVRDRDVESVEWVCKGVRDAAEMERIEHEITPLANNLSGSSQRKRVQAALALRP
ncbi:MAG: peptidoglycan-binding domain-containing protein [Solirubrobacteraceae bacterium]